MKKEEIIKEFYEVFGDERWGLDRNQPSRVVDLHKIELFWLSKLDQQKRELLKEIDRLEREPKEYSEKNTYYQALDDVRKFLK